MVPVWDRAWDECLTQAALKAKKGVSILPALVKAFGSAYFLSSVLMLVLSILQFASPQIVNLLIDFVSSDQPNWKGYFYTVLIVLVTFMVTILNTQSFYQEYLVGLRVRTALISAVYRKSLRLSNSARKEMTGGQVSTVMVVVLN